MKIDRLAVYNKCGGRCGYCGKVIAINDMQVDHYFPLWAKSAALERNIDVHAFSNLLPTCRMCNHYKRGDFPEDFREKMKTLHERIEKIYIWRVANNFSMTGVEPFNGVFFFETLKPIT